MSDKMLSPDLDSRFSKGIKATATFLNNAGSDKKGRWTVGVLNPDTTAEVEDLKSVQPFKRFTYFYNPQGWKTRMSDAMFFEDFEFMKQYLLKRKIEIVSQSTVQIKDVPEVGLMVFHDGKVIASEVEDIDTFLQETYRMELKHYNSIKFIKTTILHVI